MRQHQHTLVVKIGSSAITHERGPNPKVLAAAISAATAAQRQQWNVVLVSSGAVLSGHSLLERLNPRTENDLPQNFDRSSRLASAIGQPILMDAYRFLAEMSGSVACQILLSESDLRSRRQMEVVTDVLFECFDLNVIPIVNGNDVSDPQGSDNDLVATALAVATGAERLLFLTNVAGLTTGKDDEARVIESVSGHDLHAFGSFGSSGGRGGMRSKLRAAELAAQNGIETHIASAFLQDVIDRCIDGELVGTRIEKTTPPHPMEIRWISGIASSHGRITINREAEANVRSGSSLFASGIKKVSGSFVPGDVVDIVSPRGALIARGKPKVSAILLNLIRALRTDEVAEVLTCALGEYGRSVLRKGHSDRLFRSRSHHRPQVLSALDQVRAFGPDTKRKLAIEVMTLFPIVTVEAMLGFPGSGQSTLDLLWSRYGRMSSDLSLIDRSELAVFLSREEYDPNRDNSQTDGSTEYADQIDQAEPHSAER